MPDAPISWGELIDKLTILELKAARLSDPAALANVRRELAVLAPLEAAASDARLPALRAALMEVNATLWDIEDRIREKEATADFGAAFVELARAVYRQNDRRAALKREISLALGSDLIEEKSYGAR
ncbi:MAG TPA: DUF6165 family protein [Phenylobacterium sp.]|nr:DUF6165 family protein [Phenylobacterium sp.]